MSDEGFPARLRIKRRREFLRVQRNGRKHHVAHFLVFVALREQSAKPAGHRGGEMPADGGLPPTRLGITVTRKVGRAVVRNRIKRLVREVVRRNRRRFAPGLDMVWVAKKQAASIRLDQVVDDLEALLRRPGLGHAPRATNIGSEETP